MAKNVNGSRSPLLYIERLRKTLVVTGVISLINVVDHITFAVSVAKYIPNILNGNQSDISSFAKILVVLAILKLSSSYFGEIISAKSYIKIHDSLTKEIIFSKSKDKNSNVAHVLTSGLNSLENYIRYYVPAFVNALIIPSVCIMTIFLFDIISALIICATIGLVPLFMILIGKHTREITQTEWDGQREVRNSFAYLIEGIPTLRMYNQDKRAGEYIKKVSNRYRISLMKTLRTAFLSAFALEAIATLSVAVVAVTLGVRLVHSDVSLQNALIVLFVIPECYWPLRKLGAAYHSAEMGKDAAKEIEEVLQNQEADSDKQKIEQSSITFNDLKCAYDSENKFEYENTVIKPGELCALVGENGSGKSTLLALLRQDLDYEGHLKIGDAELSELDSNCWAQSYTFASQDSLVYGNTVRNAISFSNELEDVLVTTIASKLDILDILDKPSFEISGGQRQRVALAHAAYTLLSTNAWLLIADEPSAHLDRENSKKVKAFLLELTVMGYSVVVSTHDELLRDCAKNIFPIGKNDQSKTKVNSLKIETGIEVREQHIPEQLNEVNSINLLSQVIRKIFIRTSFTVVMASLVDIASLALAATSIWLIVRAGERPQFSELVFASLCVRIFGISKAVGRYAERLTTHRTALEIVTKLRIMTTTHLTRIMPGNFSESRKGSLLHRVIDDHDSAQELFIRSVVPLASTLFTGIFAILALSFYSAQAALLLSVGVTVGAIILPALGAYFYKTIGLLLSLSEEKYSKEIYDYADNITLIRTTNEHAYVISRISSSLSQRYDAMLSAAKTNAFLGSIYSSLGLLTVLFNIIIVKNTENMSSPMFAVILLVSFSIMSIYEGNARAGEYYYHGSFAWKRIKEILDRKATINNPSNPIEINGDELVLEDASFLWSNTNNGYHDANIKIDNSHPRITISGPSGSGKSTLAAGIVRFLDIDSGLYTIDSQNIKTTDENQVREKLLWSTQDPWLSPGSIKDNMRLAKPDVRDDEIVTVFEKINALDLISSEFGVNKIVEDKGANFSRGEQCKIALARVLLSNHKIKIFDEPTASLDKKSKDCINHIIQSDDNEFHCLLLTHD